MSVNNAGNAANPNQCVVPLGDRGRLVLPVDVRHRLGLKEGDRLLVTVLDDHSLQLTNLRREISKVRGILKSRKGKSLADELIEDRRKEQARDDSRS